MGPVICDLDMGHHHLIWVTLTGDLDIGSLWPNWVKMVFDFDMGNYMTNLGHLDLWPRYGTWAHRTDSTISGLKTNLNLSPSYSISLISSHLSLNHKGCSATTDDFATSLFWPDLMNGRHGHTTAVCVSLQWPGGLRVVRLPAGSWHGLPRW